MKLTRYRRALLDVSQLLASARAASARSLNALMTTTYFLIGKRIVEEEQGGADRAAYGQQLIERLSVDLTKTFGRGFSTRNLFLMRAFFLEYRNIVQTPSAQSFPLPWSHYVRLLSLPSPAARRFYEQEALRGGWTFKQLDRQVQSQFFERTMLSRRRPRTAQLTPEDAKDLFKEPFMLEFLDLKDEYSKERSRGGAVHAA